MKKGASTKGQSSLEFMSTYGWALAVVILTISALTYFGLVRNSSNQSSCIISPGIHCKEFKITNLGVDIVIGNSLGTDILVQTADITNLPASVTCNQFSSPFEIKDSQIGTINIQCSGISPNDKFTGQIKLIYKKVTGVLSTTASGSITGISELTQSQVLLAFLESNGQVVMEAENFDGMISRSSHSWDFGSTWSGYSGTGYMIANPDNGAIIDMPLVETTSPEITYRVKFENVGTFPKTFYVWARAAAPTGGSGDSGHVGINGILTTNGQYIDWDFTFFRWDYRSSGPNLARYVIVPSPGMHTFYFWMYEDGLLVDKILLTSDPAFNMPDLAVIGPPESPRG